MSTYKEERHAFYSQFHSFWYDINGSEYSLYHVLEVKQELLLEIQYATKVLGTLFFKMAKLVRELPDETLLQLGIPKESLPFIRFKTIEPESIISRFDFVETAEGLKLLEFNADTPTFIVESFSINGILADHFGKVNPNKDFSKRLASTVHKAIIESLKANGVMNSTPNVVFTAHESHVEDWNTVHYLSTLAGVPNQLIPLSQLVITKDALLDPYGNKIDLLYRQTYPLEHLLLDKDPIDQELIGIQLLKLVKERKLAIVNPISAFLLQSKAIQALMWGLVEQQEFFTYEERKTIKAYMLPTYLDCDSFNGQSSYVKKPSFGREGDTLTIFDKNGKVIQKNSFETYLHELPIYQKYVELPTVTMETEKGMEKLSYLFGSFLLAGEPGAISARAGGKITNNDSYFLPIGLTIK